jgi:hypothetical protein
MQREAARRDVFERYIGEIAKAINAINGTDTKKLYDILLAEAKRRTAVADAQLDEEGRTLKKDEHEDLKEDEGVVMVESRAAHLKEAEAETSAGEAPAAMESSESEGDIVRLNGKPKKAKKKPSNEDRGLF